MTRAFLAPEVVQTSAMDCGPAALKSLLEGHRIPASYGRLREACQTDVDGTSVDTLEQAAVALGLEAAQVMAPADHLPVAEAGLLPALVVVRQPNGATHFVIAWRRHGRWMQIMDPAVGRRFVPLQQFLDEVYRHTMAVPAAGWCEFAASPSWRRALDRRMRQIGVPAGHREDLLAASTGSGSWLPSARLDAAIRMAAALVASGALGRGAEAAALIAELVQGDAPISERYWTVTADPDDETAVLLSGAVLIPVAGKSAGRSEAPVSPELAAALTEPPERPLARLFGFLRRDGMLAPAMILAALLFAAAGVALEALLLRGLLDLSGELRLSGQRLAGLTAILALFLFLLLLEFPVEAGLLRAGRKLEGRLRLAFLARIPLLGDRYFQSRLTSDMAERCHTLHMMRTLPEVAGTLLRASFEMALTIAALAWFFPASGLPALAIGVVATALPLLAQPGLAARDLRWRTHTGALSRFYLDALQGLAAIRAHGAEQALRREQKGLLAEWARAGLDLQKAMVAAGGLQFALGLGLAAWLLLRHIGSGGDLAGVLLLAYWTLNLPVLGQEIAAAAWQYPGLRNVTLRLLEPLGAPNSPGRDAVDARSCRVPDSLHPEPPAPAAQTHRPHPLGAAVQLDHVTVRAAGSLILDDVSLRIAPGEHIAIVGPSGAGKSSLVGLLLGWHTPAEGALTVDGQPLDAARLATLREQTAWVDPQVRLWNRSVLDNLRYGAEEAPLELAEQAIEPSGLRGVLRKLPDGLQTALGEAGALLSGGEGQRVRFGRALTRPGVRLVILDEPARGLDRGQRRAVLEQARATWPAATILSVTHDIADTLDFPRVLVIEHGRIAEDGPPRELAAAPDSRYRALLDAERLVRHHLWSSPLWRCIRIRGGQVDEQQAPVPSLQVARS